MLHLFSQPRAAGFLSGQQEFSAANPWLFAKRMDGVTHFPGAGDPGRDSGRDRALSPGKPDFQLFYPPPITILRYALTDLPVDQNLSAYRRISCGDCYQRSSRSATSLPEHERTERRIFVRWGSAVSGRLGAHICMLCDIRLVPEEGYPRIDAHRGCGNCAVEGLISGGLTRSIPASAQGRRGKIA